MESNAEHSSQAQEKRAQILMAKRPARGGRPLAVEPVRFWTLATALGLALALVGWTELALLWHPLHFGSPEWEFGTVSSHFDGLAVATIGLIVFAIGALGLGLRRTVRVLAVVMLLIAFMNVAVYVIYLLDVPLALRGVAPELQPTIWQAMIKASIYAAIYTALYAWAGVYLWRATEEPDL